MFYISTSVLTKIVLKYFHKLFEKEFSCKMIESLMVEGGKRVSVILYSVLYFILTFLTFEKSSLKFKNNFKFN